MTAALRLCRPDTPTAFVGHSMGALVAFELDHRVRQEGLWSPVALWASAMVAPQSFHSPTEKALGDDAILKFLRDGGAMPEHALEHPELRQMIVTRMKADAAVLGTWPAGSAAVSDLCLRGAPGHDDAFCGRDGLGITHKLGTDPASHARWPFFQPHPQPGLPADVPK